MRLWSVGASLLALMVVACGGTVVTMDPETQGMVRLPLVSSAPDGKVYKLVGARFEVTGTQTVSITDTSADTVQTVLTAGTYSVKLEGTWHLERLDAPGTPVPAQLVSPNPLPFSVTKGQTTEVRFLFKLPGEGTADVGIRVDGGGWVSGTLHFEMLDGLPTSPLAELVGQDVPVLIGFETSTVNKNFSDKSVEFTTGPTVVQFGGPYSALLQRVAHSLAGLPLIVRMSATPDGRVRLDHMDLMGNGFALNVFTPMSVPGAVDAEGFPALQPFSFSADVMLYDFASGDRVRGTTDVSGSN